MGVAEGGGEGGDEGDEVAAFFLLNFVLIRFCLGVGGAHLTLQPDWLLTMSPDNSH